MTTFDPADHTAVEVHEYLAGLDDPAEYDRVVATEQEREGGPRVTALEGLARPLESGAAVDAEPDGRWERLLDRQGRPVTTDDGRQVRVR